jgi:uncharacterized protein YjaZ
MTTKQIIEYGEKVFNELAESNKIDFEERKQIVSDYIIKEFNNETMAYISTLGVNENPYIVFEEDLMSVLAFAQYKDNRIFVSIEKMKHYLKTDFQTCYKKEYKFIQRNVKTKKDAIAWTICHEYAHLLRLEKRPHNNNFFQLVEKLYKSLKR